MKKIILTLSLAICFVAVINAQDYKTGIGLRSGYYNGITVKHFISSKAAIEGLVYFRWAGTAVTGLYEIHSQAFKVERLNWYYGGGAHVGFYGSSYGGGSGTFIGLDGILGLEYNFKEVPINLSLDWKPAFDFGYSHFFGDGGALSIRYIF
jgi:hypothetical protein